MIPGCIECCWDVYTGISNNQGPTMKFLMVGIVLELLTSRGAKTPGNPNAPKLPTEP